MDLYGEDLGAFIYVAIIVWGGFLLLYNLEPRQRGGVMDLIEASGPILVLPLLVQLQWEPWSEGFVETWIESLGTIGLLWVWLVVILLSLERMLKQRRTRKSARGRA